MSEASLQNAVNKLGGELGRIVADTEALREQLEIQSRLNSAFVELLESNNIDWKEELGITEVPPPDQPAQLAQLDGPDEEIITQVEAN